MHTVAVIQARMGSTRLPGKMLFGLGGRPVIQRVIQRVSAADLVDEIVVATSDHPRDDAIEQYADQSGVTVFRGSESDVLGRVYAATRPFDPDIVVRICGDCPLIDPALVDAVVDRVADETVDYASNTVDRTFPDGIVAEAFTDESFGDVVTTAEDDQYREHVTLFYHDHAEKFYVQNITSQDVYSDSFMQHRTDLRFVLDVAADYTVLRRVYGASAALGIRNGVLDVRDAVRYADEHGLCEMNTDAD
jgi:spore coat polysaccharide biosynthesis protein SpsF